MKKRFGELPIGNRFCFGARRYEKVAAEIGRDEERGGNVFHANTEVFAEVQGRPSRTGHECEGRAERRRIVLAPTPPVVHDQDLKRKERARVPEEFRERALADLADLCPWTNYRRAEVRPPNQKN